MAQHDYNISNQSGAAFRADLNNALSAIVSNNSGAVEPSTTYAYQFWADTTAGVLKQRNAANSAWVTLFQLDGEWSTIALENGTGAAPSLYFKDSGTDTGLYSPGVDQLGVATAGVQRVNFNGATEVVFNDTGADVDFRIEGDTEPNLFVIDAGTDQVRVKNLNGGPLAGTRNRIINGDMRIDQRNAGASVTTVSGGGYYFSTDRFITYNLTGVNYTTQRVAEAPAGFTNSAKLTFANAFSLTTTGEANFQQLIEGFNVADLGWGTASAQPVTASFWVRSSFTGTFSVGVANASGARAYATTYSINAANTWEYKSVTIPGDTSGTWTTDNSAGLLLRFMLASGSNYVVSANNTWTTRAGAYNAADSIFGTRAIGAASSISAGSTWQITGVQLEAGSFSTPFERRSYAQELSLCQRYFEKTYDTDVAVGSIGDAGSWVSVALNTADYYNFGYAPFKVTKRIAPTVIPYSVATGASGKVRQQAAVDLTSNASQIGVNACRFNTSGATTGNFHQLHYTASAEL